MADDTANNPEQKKPETPPSETPPNREAPFSISLPKWLERLSGNNSAPTPPPARPQNNKPSAKSLQKQQRKQMAREYTAQAANPIQNAPSAPVLARSNQTQPLLTRIRSIFSRNKKPVAQPTPPSGGTVKRGGSFQAFDQYAQNTQQNLGAQQPKPSKKTGGAGLALGALGGLVGGAGKKLTSTQQPAQRENAGSQRSGIYDQSKETTSDQGFVEKTITSAEIPGARDRAWHFFIWASEYPELYSFHPFDQQTPRFQQLLSSHPEIPRNVLELKQTFEQYWAQFPEGIKSEHEQQSREQAATTPPQQSASLPNLSSLAPIPLIAATYAKESLDPKRQHDKKAVTILRDWQKKNPETEVGHELFVHTANGELAVNHKLFSSVPELHELEKTRTYAYKNADDDPLIKHLQESSIDERKAVEARGRTLGKDNQTILREKNQVLADKYSQFANDHPKLASAYKDHPHVKAALEQNGVTQTPATRPLLGGRIKTFDRFRSPSTRQPTRTPTERPGSAPRRPRNARRPQSPLSFLPSPLSVFNPARQTTLLLIIIIGGISLFLLISDIQPIPVEATEDEVSITQQCQNGSLKDCDPIPNPKLPTDEEDPREPIGSSGSNFFGFLPFSLKAFAQTISPSPAPTNPTTANDATYTITISYPKASKDIIIVNSIPENAIYISSDPPYTDRQTEGGRVLQVSWSLKKLQNPNASGAAQLEALTLPPVSNFPIKLTLRPRSNARDTRIINQAIARLYPLPQDALPQVPGQTNPPGGVPNVEQIPPTTDTCGGRIQLNNPIGKNFGDPACNFTEDGLYNLLKKEDPENADYWFNVVVPCESPGRDPNLYYRTGAAGTTPDAGGAWGLFQMGSSNNGAGTPGNGLNGPYDRGDVAWTQQVVNATTYRRNVSWRYWACARDRW